MVKKISRSPLFTGLTNNCDKKKAIIDFSIIYLKKRATPFGIAL
jgi:hypothetical protein